MCLGGSNGEFIQVKTTWIHGLPPSHEAEVLGLNEAII